MKRIAMLLVMLAFLLSSSVMLFAGGDSEEKADGPVTVSWWVLSGGGGADDPRTEHNKKIVADFEASHPGIKIEMTVLENEAFKQKSQVAVQAGTPPDLFHSWGGGVMVEFAKSGMLRDVTDFAMGTLSKRIGIGTLGVFGYDGKYYGAPYDMGGVFMWYNKDIFKECGVNVPATFEELKDACVKIKAKGYVPIALGAGDRWPAHFWWVYLAMRVGGIDAFNAAYGGSGSFKDEAFVRAGELLLELAAVEPFQEGYLGATYNDEARMVGNGEAAMELMGHWAPGVRKNNAGDAFVGDKFDIFTFPSVKGGAGDLKDVMGGGGGYIFGKDAPDEAMTFVDFLLSKEIQMEKANPDIEGIIPVVKGAEAALEGISVKIAESVAAAPYYQLYYDQYLPPAVGEAVKDAVVALLGGQVTPEGAAAMIDDAWQAEK